MEVKKKGRPSKEAVAKQTEKEKYVVKTNFFYKGAQFHQGQEMGYNEALLKMGKIERLTHDESEKEFEL